MKEYIIAVSAAVIITELILMLMPDGGIKKFSKTALGVLLMMMILMPLHSCEFSMQEAKAEENAELTYSGIIMDVYNGIISNNN